MKSVHRECSRFGEFSGTIESVGCPICGNPPPPKLIYRRPDNIKIWLCAKCEVMYASPRFTEESLLKIYEHQAFADLSFYEGWNYETWQRENRDRSYVTQLLKIQLMKRFLPSGVKILDVGCGTGLFCLEASKHGFEPEGIDPSGRLTEIGHRVLKVPVKQGRLEEFSPGCLYSGIFMWDVLEHVYNPLDLVKKCRSLLERQGSLFVQVPNYKGLSNRAKTFLCRRGFGHSDFKHFGFPWHLYAFSEKSLAELMREGGLIPVLFESWSHHLKEGSGNPLSKVVIEIAKRFCLSDYLTCVAQRVN